MFKKSIKHDLHESNKKSGIQGFVLKNKDKPIKTLAFVSSVYLPSVGAQVAVHNMVSRLSTKDWKIIVLYLHLLT